MLAFWTDCFKNRCLEEWRCGRSTSCSFTAFVGWRFTWAARACGSGVAGPGSVANLAKGRRALAGMRESGIIGGHLLPNFAGYLIVNVSLDIPGMILAETALSFLGLGLRSPAVSWGAAAGCAEDPQRGRVPVADYPRSVRGAHGAGVQLRRRRPARRRGSLQVTHHANWAAISRSRMRSRRRSSTSWYSGMPARLVDSSGSCSRSNNRYALPAAFTAHFQRVSITIASP